MKLKIRHETRYSYDKPVQYALQRLRLRPRSSTLQSVLSWTVEIEGAQEEVTFLDQFGNDTMLISVSGGSHEVVIVAEGEVETHNRAGVFGQHAGYAPLWLFQHETPLTAVSEPLRELADACRKDDSLATLHALSAAIRDRVAYTVGATGPDTTAEMALAQGEGVCQDHSHIFLAGARALGMPARYVSGYLLLDDRSDQVASHAWVEAHVVGLGWVGFDVSNGISPDERYARLAVGRDYRDAMPASGVRLGPAKEALAVAIHVEQ